MNKELDYILSKYSIDPRHKCPVELNISRLGGLTGLFNELGYRAGAEIGVDFGKFSERICQDAPNTKLYCIDPWLAHINYSKRTKQSQFDSAYAETVERLSKFSNYEIIRKTSEEAVKDFAPNSLDFVYIDGNHQFKYVAKDIINWDEIVRPGGMVSGHDYRQYNRKLIHVVEATQAYTSSYHIQPWFILGRSDDACSWFWIKQ